MLTRTRSVLVAASLAATLGLAACGGGGSADGIGAAGGTVTASSGASVAVPAGALAQATPIAIAADAAGAPALPDGTTTVGEVHALTPHGTSFATPVTLTLPYDAGRVPAGASVQLLKTNAARDGWEPVAGATVGTATVSAPLSGFSWVVAVAAATASGGLTGTWNSLYICEPDTGGSFSGDDTLVVTQSGNNISFTVSDGANGVGTLDGDTVTWTSAGPGYTERGTWTVIGPDSMVKRSTYTNNPSVGGGGTCSGSLHRVP